MPQSTSLHILGGDVMGLAPGAEEIKCACAVGDARGQKIMCKFWASANPIVPKSVSRKMGISPPPGPHYYFRFKWHNRPCTLGIRHFYDSELLVLTFANIANKLNVLS